jgi:hypothetical protein
MAKTPPLVFETIQNDLNYQFLTLIEYKRVKYLTVVENVLNNEIHAYVLDNLAAEGLDQQWFLSVATRWFYAASDRYPLSFEFTKFGRGDAVKKVLKTFNINSTSRVIGKLFVYETSAKPKIKRRKVQQYVEVASIKLKA